MSSDRAEIKKNFHEGTSASPVPLRVLYIGNDIRILEAVCRLCRVEGVYIRWPIHSRRTARSLLLRLACIRSWVRWLCVKKTVGGNRWQKELSAYEFYDHVRQCGLPVWRAPSLRSEQLLRCVEHAGLDLGIVASCGEILPESLCSLVRFGCINFHPSLLPRYRGPSPIAHILLQGESQTGVTWHYIAKRVDAGDIVAQDSFEISSGDSEREVMDQSVSMGIRLLEDLLPRITAGQCKGIPQNEAEATYFPRLTPEEKIRISARTR